jgi:hypothetical protein
MVSGNWLDNDNLYHKYGTSLADPENAGEYQSPAGNRVIEVLIDVSKLTTTASIQSDTTFFPSGTNIFIEKVEAVVETAVATITSISVGLIQQDRATIPSNYSTAFINAETALSDAGDSITYNEDTTNAGGLIGSSPSSTTGPYYITALIAGSVGTGKIRVRIYYHGIGTISF